MTELKLTSVPQESLETFIQLVVLVAFADGELSEQEAYVLSTRVVELSAGRVSKEWVLDQCQELPPRSQSANNWRAELVDRIKDKLVDKELRRAAFQVAMEVARADAGLGAREGMMLANLAVQLDLKHDDIKEFL
jgi:tellurite resistance protein